jgi:hypothetical protein
MRRLITALVVLSLLIVLGTGSSAQARWGGESCSWNSHCYAIAVWNMKGCPKECIDGGVADIGTSEIYLPESYPAEQENFITNEMWVGLGAGWVEEGQIGIASPGYFCCAMSQFIGHSYDGKHIYTWIRGYEALNGYHSYVMQDLDHSGVWRYYVGRENTNWEELGQYGGYPAQTKVLNAGMEAASNSQPSNQGQQFLAAVYSNSWHPWGGVYAHVGYEHEPGTWITPNNPSWPGNASYGVVGGPGAQALVKPASQVEMAATVIKSREAEAEPGSVRRSSVKGGTLVTMEGRFTPNVPIPKGHALPTATNFAVLIAPTGSVSEYIGTGQPNVAEMEVHPRPVAEEEVRG